jgi:hypothetical protein
MGETSRNCASRIFRASARNVSIVSRRAKIGPLRGPTQIFFLARG